MQARFISDLWCLVSMNLKRKKSTLGGFIYRLQNSPYFCVFKYARAAKQKVWNEAENRQRDWGETLNIRFTLLACEALALCARKILTPCFTDFFTDFEKKKPTVLQSSDGKFFPPISRPPA